MQGKDFGEAFPEQQRAWEQERETFKAVLERHGVEVLRPRLMTEAEKASTGSAGYGNFFVRDPWFTIGNNVIEGVLRLPHRRVELLPSRTLLHEHVMPSRANYVSTPSAGIGDGASGDPGPFLEGSDVLVLDKHVFVGNSGLASDDAGYKWLKKYLAPQGYTVEQVLLAPQVLHLDCAIGLVREGLMLVCEERLLNGVPERLRDWDPYRRAREGGHDARHQWSAAELRDLCDGPRVLGSRCEVGTPRREGSWNATA